MEHLIKAATADDRDSILALLPRLAEFKLPKHRAPRELWNGDANMVKQWANGERDELDVWVALRPHTEEEEPVSSQPEPQESLNSVDSESALKTAQPESELPTGSETGMPNGFKSSVSVGSNTDTTNVPDVPVVSESNAVKTERTTQTVKAKETAPSQGKVIGASIVSYKPELLNGKASAHLEVMVVDKDVEGQGVASALMKHAQKMAAINGARSMSLHVFATNTNARTFYEKHDFDGELMRYSKPLKSRKIHNFFGKHVATSGVARSIKKLLRRS